MDKGQEKANYIQYKCIDEDKFTSSLLASILIFKSKFPTFVRKTNYGSENAFIIKTKSSLPGLYILFCVDIVRERCNSSECSKYFRANIFICYQNVENFGFLLNHNFLSLRRYT